MESSVRSYKRSRSSAKFTTFVKSEFRKDYVVPFLDHQKYGILSKTLWTGYDSVLRIIPGYDPETKTVFRQNINCTQYCMDDPKYMNYLSDTFYQANTVNMFGERKQSFITDYRPGSPEELKYGGNTVINAFARDVYFSVNSTKKSKLGVSLEMRQWAGKNGTLHVPRESLLMQALVFKINGQGFTDSDKNPLLDENGQPLPMLSVVAMDHKRSIHNMLQALVEPLDPNKPLDAITNNKYGGMAEMEGNILYLNHVKDVATGKESNVLKPSVQAPGAGWTPEPYYLGIDAVHALWHPWKQLLHFMTPEEQMRLLAAEFSSEAVNYVIGINPAFRDLEIPDDIASAGYGIYSEFMGGARTVPETIHMSSATPQNNSPRGLGMGSPTPRPMGSPAPTRLDNPATGMAPKPLGGLSGIPANSGIDKAKLEEQVAQIRRAQAGVQEVSSGNSEFDSQSEVAASLLDDSDDWENVPDEDIPGLIPGDNE